ncbi:RNHCP domain-containing protein [Candidatus Gracilibacteria bacterium]|nr:RNHCP domain-containing protein [Candidatus Gracilibacteria bacterium]
MRNETFICLHCQGEVSLHPSGSARNHCPHCLYSQHLDADIPGDRLSDCKGLMKPIDFTYKKNKGDMIQHQCEKCGKTILNKTAPDDKFIEFVRQKNSEMRF